MSLQLIYECFLPELEYLKYYGVILDPPCVLLDTSLCHFGYSGFVGHTRPLPASWR